MKKIIFPKELAGAGKMEISDKEKSAFNPKTGNWDIKWPGRIAKHDVVYLSPPVDPMQGMPAGNGDIGVLCWCEESRIIIAVNKCDLWDDAKFGRFHNWKAEEEDYSTTLRHACRIIIDFKVPVFDLFYLSDFSGRISISDATLNLAARGPFGSVSFKSFVSYDSGLIYCKTKSELRENIPVDIIVERYGSRTFSHWYCKINRDASIGIKGTSSSISKNGVYIMHKLTEGRFAIGCRIVDNSRLNVRYSREHSYCVKASVSGNKKKKFDFIVAVTFPCGSDPIKIAKKKLDVAEKEKFNKLFAAHKKVWKTFWIRSLMECGDDYLDNLWHLTMYYANSSQAGKYPGRFLNGLWGWNRDVQPWNFYFHWNQQQVYWPLNAAGHHDLVESYLEYRFNSLPQAKKDAKNIFKADGAFISDVAERRGFNSVGEVHNHTPVAEIAMDFWRQYCFTGDRNFLKGHAVPFILEAARYFKSLFKLGDDAKYHAKEGTGYEGWIRLKDSITELVYANVLFTTVMKALDEAGIKDPNTTEWKDILDNLAPIIITRVDKDCIKNDRGVYRFNRGLFRGDTAFSDKIFGAGFGIKEKRILTSFVPNNKDEKLLIDPLEILHLFESSKYRPDLRDMIVYDGIFPAVTSSAVFPSGFVGLLKKRSELFNVAVNTSKLYAPECMGLDPLPIVFARLGFSRELSQILRNWPRRWQLYCNGFGHYGPEDVFKADAKLRFRTNFVFDASIPEKEWENFMFSFPTWPFRHMGMESMSVLACAMNESLLQSYDGVIRVAPAVTKDQHSRFTLHGQEGFIVSAEIQNGKPLWIAVKSRLGKTCKLENPWQKVFIYANGKEICCKKQRIIEFSTSVDDIYIIVPGKDTMKNWKMDSIHYKKNTNVKNHASGYALLGIPRMF